MTDKQKETNVSRKEYARQMRRAAYVRAKELRAKDPRQLALKAAAKERRRELYQKAKARSKAKAQGEKARLRDRKAEKRTATDIELMKFVKADARK
jgi:hypothetical protein